MTSVFVSLADEKSWRAEAEIDMELFHQVQISVQSHFPALSDPLMALSLLFPFLMLSTVRCPGYSKIERDKKRDGTFL